MRPSLALGLLASALCVIAALVLVRVSDIEVTPEVRSADASLPMTPVESHARTTERTSDFADRTPVRVDDPQPAPRPDSAEKNAITVADLLPVDEDAPPIGTITVHVVRDEDGGPAAGAEVLLDPPRSWSSSTRASETLTTDASGSVSFSAVLQGYSSLTITAAGRAVEQTGTDVQPQAPVVTIEVRLRVRRQILVRMLDALGRPFRAADWGLEREDIGLLGLVVAGACGRLGETFHQDGAPTHTARAGGSGPFTWTVELLGAGNACVQAVLGDTVVGAEPLLPDVTEVAVLIDPVAIDAAKGSVIVHVTEVDGVVPIVGAEIEFHRGSWQDVVVQTGSDGRARCRLALPAGATAVVRAPSHAPILVVLERPLPPEVLVRLAPARAIVGRVVDDAGRPIPSAKVFLRGGDRSDPRLLPSKVSHVLCATDGSFRFQDLPAFEFELTASAKSSKGNATMQKGAHADCRLGDVNDLVIAVPIGNQ